MMNITSILFIVLRYWINEYSDWRDETSVKRIGNTADRVWCACWLAFCPHCIKLAACVWLRQECLCAVYHSTQHSITLAIRNWQKTRKKVKANRSFWIIHLYFGIGPTLCWESKRVSRIHYTVNKITIHSRN